MYTASNAVTSLLTVYTVVQSLRGPLFITVFWLSTTSITVDNTLNHGITFLSVIVTPHIDQIKTSGKSLPVLVDYMTL